MPMPEGNERGPHEADPPGRSPGHRRLMARSSEVLGQPVRDAARLQVEGFLPYYWVGLVLGIVLLRGGVLGVLIGVGAGIGIGRIATRNRARGLGMSTVLAVTDTQVHALKLSRRTAQPVAAWPRDEVASRLRRKRVTYAVTLDRPDAPPIRLELLYYLFRNRPQAFIDNIRTPTTGAGSA
jgi:hypothetical protein